MATPRVRRHVAGSEPPAELPPPVLGPEETDDVPLTFDSPESELVAQADYDPNTEVLTIELRRGGAYRYTAFPAVLWREFYQAESKGKFFQSRIRPIFPGRKVAAV